MTLEKKAYIGSDQSVYALSCACDDAYVDPTNRSVNVSYSRTVLKPGWAAQNRKPTANESHYIEGNNDPSSTADIRQTADKQVSDCQSHAPGN